MPVTVMPSPELVGYNRDPVVRDPVVCSVERLIWRIYQARAPLPDGSIPLRGTLDRPEKRPVIQSSFGDLNDNLLLIPYDNGMVNGIIRAYQQDLHLILRPDDVWLSILTQFNIFVNANSECLRAHFVAHGDKKNLMVDIRPHPLWSLNMGTLAKVMTRLIKENVVDAELRDWINPNFSTTTEDDKSVAAIVMMGTLLSCYNYQTGVGCGFPSVTLLGQRSDWEEILRKVGKLPKYGPQTAEWSRHLTPVIEHMIASFDQPNAQRVKDFWLRACYSTGEDRYGLVHPREPLTGWITAFCFWSTDGTCVTDYLNEKLTPIFDCERLILDNVAYPMIWPKSIPAGVVSVPVGLEDHATRLEYKTTMVAGSVGMTATDRVIGGMNQTTVQPRSGWFMIKDSVKPMGSV